MTKANPYDRFVSGKDPVHVLRETPRKLREIVDGLVPAGLERSLEPGKWPARNILSHLADCELAFGFRLRQLRSIDEHVMQPFDQDAWALPYDALSAQHALEAFTAVRGWNLSLIKTFTPQDLERKARHPERGELTMQTLLETMAGHDINHLLQLAKIREQ